MNATRLPHVLAPEAYFSPEHHQRELARLFEPGWHFAATLDDLPSHGDFVTLELLGRPLIVRNHQGEPRAYLNVCAHRHCLLTHAPRGKAPVRLRCQYHGWEYDAEGRACKIPDASCFLPVKKGGERLVCFRTETVGRLVFVQLSSEGPPLEKWLGERACADASRLFSAEARQAVALSLDHPCNWKIPIENVLESYHVPMLHDNVVARHPGLFRLFKGAPAGQAGQAGGQREAHELGEGFSAVHDELGADSALYRALVGAFRPEAKLSFVHLHAFPNLLIGETSVVRFFQATTPVSPTSSRSLVRIFLDLGQPGRGLAERLIAPLADRLARALFLGLMSEDAPVYPDVQRGLAASPHPGALGSREERIHHFHTFVERAVR